MPTQTQLKPQARGAPDELPFGEILGISEGVPCYSSDYDNHPNKRSFAGRSDYRSQSNDGVYFGYKWQCVELARRYLVSNYGYTFGDVPMAYHIFDLTNVTRLSDGASLPLAAHPNGASDGPVVGSLLIWDRSYDNTGHVAVVTGVTEDGVCIVEQNYDDVRWPKGQNYARKLPLRVADGRYYVEDKYKIMGWMTQH